jgi:TRAP-type mannitol/chloroaromatic compound transport system permease small subunit
MCASTSSRPACRKRTNAIIDAVGIVVFTIPLSIIMIDLGWPLFSNAFTSAR